MCKISTWNIFLGNMANNICVKFLLEIFFFAKTAINICVKILLEIFFSRKKRKIYKFTKVKKLYGYIWDINDLTNWPNNFNMFKLPQAQNQEKCIDPWKGCYILQHCMFITDPRGYSEVATVLIFLTLHIKIVDVSYF